MYVFLWTERVSFYFSPCQRCLKFSIATRNRIVPFQTRSQKPAEGSVLKAAFTRCTNFHWYLQVVNWSCGLKCLDFFLWRGVYSHLWIFISTTVALRKILWKSFLGMVRKKFSNDSCKLYVYLVYLLKINSTIEDAPALLCNLVLRDVTYSQILLRPWTCLKIDNVFLLLRKKQSLVWVNLHLSLWVDIKNQCSYIYYFNF